MMAAPMSSLDLDDSAAGEEDEDDPMFSGLGAANNALAPSAPPPPPPPPQQQQQQQQGERILEFLSDKAKRRELCQGRTEYGHMCLQTAEENGYCKYHHAQLQNSSMLPWDERLYIVLDLDQTLVYTPTDGEEFPSNVRLNVQSSAPCGLNIQEIFADGATMQTAIRPFALEILEQLGSMFSVSVITGGTPSYCKAIVDLLNRLSNKEIIKEGVSCRSASNPMQAQAKTFNLVLHNPQDERFALAIDNCRKAWARECRDQVVIVPDWAPHLLIDEQENLLKQVIERVLQVHDRLRKRAFRTPSGGLALPATFHVADVLQALYEEEEKARMLRRALSERVDSVVKLMRQKVYFRERCPGGAVDWVLVLGVLEYMPDYARFARELRAYNASVVMTYAGYPEGAARPQGPGAQRGRLPYLWRNSLRVAEVWQVMHDAGFAIVEKRARATSKFVNSTTFLAVPL
eukprot:m51a1_g4648 hypothetical protein (460) ;mRNA; f:12252-15835